MKSQTKIFHPFIYFFSEIISLKSNSARNTRSAPGATDQKIPEIIQSVETNFPETCESVWLNFSDVRR